MGRRLHQLVDAVATLRAVKPAPQRTHLTASSARAACHIASVPRVTQVTPGDMRM